MSRAKRLSSDYQPTRSFSHASWWLYGALVPLFFSVGASLFAGEYRRFVLKLIGFALWSVAAAWISRGIRLEREYEQAAIAKAPKLPYKLLGGALFALGVLHLGWIVGGAPLWQALFVAVLAFAGVWLYYGSDPRTDKLPESDDINPELLLRSLTEARDTLAKIRRDTEEIHDLRLHREIGHAVEKAEHILDTIAEDPKDLRVARKFLVVYIDGIAKVVERYRAVEESEIDDSTRERLYTLLREVQERFDKELERLKSNEHFDLDVQIDALRRQLED